MGEATQVAEIAAGLTKAQRLLVPRMSDGELVFPLVRILEDASIMENLKVYRKAMAQLRRDGLAEHGPLMSDEGEVRGSGTWLTPLGLAVRAHLMQERP